MDERENTDGFSRRIMEQRSNLRLPVQGLAELHLTTGAGLRGELRDASFEGAYVRVAHMPRAAHGCGRLRLHGVVGEQPLIVDIPVLAVRLDSDGIGLMFGDYGAPVEHGLRRLFNDSFSKR